MTKIIINADDFGLSRGVNYGIIDAFNHGVLSSTTLMPNMPGTSHAIELAKKNPKLAIGVHLTLTTGKPILDLKNSLTTDEGKFHPYKYFLDGNKVDAHELFNEWDAQIQFLLDQGLVLSHIDSHHHAHSFEGNEEVVTKLGQKYNLPIRPFNGNKFGSQTVDCFSVDLEEVAKVLADNAHEGFTIVKEQIRTNDTIEFMCHPGYVDYYLMENSSYTTMRANTIEFLINSPFANALKENDDIQLINYFDLKICQEKN